MTDTDLPSAEPTEAPSQPTEAHGPAQAREPVGVRKPRVAIVFGGRSSEHAVSCATAAGVMRAIDRSLADERQAAARSGVGAMSPWL